MIHIFRTKAVVNLIMGMIEMISSTIVQNAAAVVDPCAISKRSGSKRVTAI